MNLHQIILSVFRKGPNMEWIAIIVGGLGAFTLGIPWYMVLAKPWMKAAGISDEQASNANPIIYMITLFMWIVSSFFLQRYLMQDATSLVEALRPAFAAWAALGLLSTTLSTLYGMRGRNLLWIDAGYTLAGAIVIAIVHTLLYP